MDENRHPDQVSHSPGTWTWRSIILIKDEDYSILAAELLGFGANHRGNEDQSVAGLKVSEDQVERVVSSVTSSAFKLKIAEGRASTERRKAEGEEECKMQNVTSKDRGERAKAGMIRHYMGRQQRASHGGV